RRAELGAIAPIDIIQAEADMKAAQQDVITEESQVLQQEMILKNYLTRGGLDNPLVAVARIVQAEADMKAAQQDVITEESQVLQQEMILKNYLTRGGMDNPLVAVARIV